MTSSVAASIHEIAPDTYRINIPLPDAMPGGFSFNQYLVLDEKPLLFHTGPKKLFPLIRAQIETVMPLARLRYVAFSHFEADECGSLPEFLAAAPEARPVCSDIAAMVSVSDFVDVPPIGMRDGEELELGRHTVVWQSAPHLPHGWECGFLFDKTTRLLFSGDLFTQPGHRRAPDRRRRHPRAERSVPAADGLLRACAGHRQAHRQARGAGTRVPRVHARQRVARQRRRAAAGPRQGAGRLGLRPTPPRSVRRQRNRKIASCGGRVVAAMLCRCSRPPPTTRAPSTDVATRTLVTHCRATARHRATTASRARTSPGASRR